MGKRESHEGPRLRKWGWGFRGDGKREKAIHEWGRGGCNSWVEKVNATAGRDWGHQRAGKDDHHLGLWAQVQPAKWECGGGREGWAYQALSFLSFPQGAKTLPSPSFSPFLRMSGRGGGCSLAHCPLSPCPSHSPHPRPHTVLSRSGGPCLQAGPRRTSARSSSFPCPQASGPGPQFLHPHSLGISVPPFPHLATSASRPSLRNRIPGPRPVPAPHPPQLGQALTSGAPRPQHKRRRCCSSAPDAAPASSSSSSFPPPPAALDGPGALSQEMLVWCPGVTLSFLPPPPDP